MPEVRLTTGADAPKSFDIYDEKGKQGEMIFDIAGNDMTIYHTEVEPESEGKGYAKLLLNNMVGYAREHQLKVIPMCAYVYAQFKRHEEEYDDVWNRRNDNI
ncbi:GNAT family N-acetyltransferase [Pedobacter sp. MR2016-24]|uniref:GNAT family N-acetyltransferase n=1 Tax=Pedobacter sp. MR2016-24 TaxID=2994466 RepID=UPI002246C554|nr:GNAT family N-acetyltransferase [Pedobacter sp. MR2016-24]MCX2484983.1 GNAT family N-acetyltransferase [Pedobacter sp. MR2016-24]